MRLNHATPFSRKLRPLSAWMLLCTALCRCTLLGAESEESRINGRWKWTLTMPDGSVVSPVARLKLEGQILSGTSKFRHASETAISDGRMVKDQVQFEVIRNLKDQRVVTRYSGAFSGDRIQGHIESNWTGQKQVYDWDAKRLPDSPEGNWQWLTQVREHRLEYSLKLKQDGDKISGKLTARKGQGVEMRHGHYKNEEVAFEVEREREGEKFVSKFIGKLVGDVIRGRETVIQGKEEKVYEWIAYRVD